MATIQLYDKLLQFPLFKGMSHDELMQVVAHTKMDFAKVEEGKKIAKEGELCNHFIFVINGTMEIKTVSDDHSYSVVEEISAPYLIQPEEMFGLTQRYRSTFSAKTKTGLLTIDKKEVMKLGENFLVFRINLLNLYTSHIHKLQRSLWRHQSSDLRKRIIRFIVAHSQYPAGKKTFYILMEQLGIEVNDSRLDVSRALNSLQDEGVLKLKRGRFEVPMLEKLIQWEEGQN